MSPAQLKDWFCNGRDCRGCPHNTAMICGFSSWLFSESKEEVPSLTLWEDEPLDTLHLQPRVQRALFTQGIRTLGQLYSIRLYDLKQYPGIGDVIAGVVSKVFYRYTGVKMNK